jgi:hypothetical protein
VPPSLHPLFEHVAPARTETASTGSDAPTAKADVGARVRSLWA